jgi:hypothetical protein
MDDSRFDALVRALVNPSRRAVFFALTATLLGGALTSDADEVEAKRTRNTRGTPDTRQTRDARHDGHEAVEASGKKKKKKKKKKKRPASRRVAPPPPGCVPESTAQTCAGRCGEVANTCGTPVNCGSCVCSPVCPLCQRCNAATGRCEHDTGACCSTGRCAAGVCEACGICETCSGGSCGPVAEETACAGGVCCGTPRSCVDINTDAAHCGACGDACPAGQTCQGGVCGFACGSDFCPAATEICDAGTCAACHVCASCTHTTIQQAIDAADARPATDTIRICAGTYLRSGTSGFSSRVADIQEKDLTLIGAGAASTFLDGGNVSSDQPVVLVLDSTTELRQLTVRGANGHSGILNSSLATLTLQDVSVTGNHAGTLSGGGIRNIDVLILNAGTRISGNTASSGGGIRNEGTVTLHAGASVTGNTATGGNGGGILNGGTVVRNSGSTISGNTPNDCVDAGGTSCS